MRLEGNLDTMSMASLVQAICIEKRKAALILKNQPEEGVIFFDQGEIAHATLGSLAGEEAVYELVAWMDGSFQVRDYETLPRRTVFASWNQLLLEAMRIIDEQRETIGPEVGRSIQPLSPAELQQDQDFENAWIILLSNLEQARAKLADPKVHEKVNQVVSTLARMLDIFEKFLNEYFETCEEMEYVIDPKLCASEASKVEELLERCLRSGDKTFQRNVEHRDFISDRQRTFQTLRTSVLGLHEMYFSNLAVQFNSSATADRWIETSSIFIDELSKTFDQIQS